jgi:membrane fusion protein
MPLFRPESLRSQDRLHGDVNLAPPTSWQMISILLVAIFAAAIAFMCVARYSRTAEAEGVIESDRGTVDLVAPSDGVISRIMATEGQHVRRGQAIAILTRATLSGNATLEQRRIDAIRAQREALARRDPAMRGAAAARMAEYESDEQRARTDQAEISSQMDEQRALIAAAAADLAKAQEVAVRGFISQRDIRVREEALASRQQGMSRLTQAMTSARADERAARRRIEQERATLATQMAQAGSEQAALEVRAADDDNVPTTTIVSPVDGVVADLSRVVTGRSLAHGQAVVTVLPDGGSLRIRLRLPAMTVPQVAPGQDARISIEAFPYQTYGTVPARIVRVTEASAPGEEFVALASLAARSVRAYGVDRPLRPGMRVTARIRTDSRTLVQWLLDPLYAVARR